jgi:hypothetical protein
VLCCFLSPSCVHSLPVTAATSSTTSVVVVVVDQRQFITTHLRTVSVLPPYSETMKISIEVELQPEEIPLAVEMFQVLRQIADHVRPTNTKALFVTLIQRLEDESALESVATDVARLLIDAGGGSEQVFATFFEAFEEVVFTSNTLEVKPVLPYLLLLPLYVRHLSSTELVGATRACE